MREVVVARVVRDGVRDVLSGQCDDLRTEALGQAQGLGDPIALRVTEVQVAAGLDMDRCPGSLQVVRHALGEAHDICAGGSAADAGEHSLAGRPRARDRVRLHIAHHLRVDALRGAAQREFPERGQIALGEIVPDSTFGLLRHIDLAVPQALDQIVWCQVDDLDVVGLVDDRIWHRLAHADTGDAGDHIVQAFDVLHIERCVDIDTGGDQFLDIHVAFWMAAAWRVGVREFIDQRQLRTACQQGVEVHFLQGVTTIFDRTAGDDFEVFEEGLGFLAAVGFDDAHDHISALAAAGLCGGEHFEGLADAWGGTHEDLQTTTRCLLRVLQQRVRGRSAFA